MNPTIALNEFTNFAEQDSRLFFGVQQAAQAHVRGLLVVLAWLLYPIFFYTGTGCSIRTEKSR